MKAGASPDQPLLVEEFVHGPEVAVEGVLTNGELSVLAVFDKPDPLEGPFFEETLYVTPSRLGATELRAVTTTTQAATRALNLREGPVHAELRVRGGRAWVIEVAARSIGGLCSRTLEFGTGMSLEYLILAHALGRPVDSLRRAHAAAGVLMLPIGAGGILAEVAGRERALAVPGIVGIELTIAPGRRLVPLPEGNRYLGFVFARAPPRTRGGGPEGGTRGAGRSPGAGTTGQAAGGRTVTPRAASTSFASAMVWRPKWKIEAASPVGMPHESAFDEMLEPADAPARDDRHRTELAIRLVSSKS